MQSGDVDVVQALTIVLTTIVIVGFFLRDALYTLLDPRVRV